MFEKQREFEDRLKKDFPNLFPKDENGNPTSPCCGLCCPEPWMDIVYNLFACMDAHCSTYTLKASKKWYKRLQMWFYQKISVKICNKLWRAIDPRWPSGKKFMTSQELKDFEAQHPKRIKWRNRIQRFSNKLRPKSFYEKFNHPAVTIAQVKSKFSELCVYYDGGDDQIKGMVRLAETLASKIPRK